MLLNKDQFPITIQAYELSGNKELFIAEQVVNSQSEVDTFSTRYAGKLIKAKTATVNTDGTSTTTRHVRRKSSVLPIVITILVVLAILIAIGFYTGWIQRTTGITL
jgi:hypothetical protein